MVQCSVLNIKISVNNIYSFSWVISVVPKSLSPINIWDRNIFISEKLVMSYLRGGTDNCSWCRQESCFRTLFASTQRLDTELFDPSVLVYTFLFLSKRCRKGLRYFIAFLINLVYLVTTKGLCRRERHKMDKILHKGEIILTHHFSVNYAEEVCKHSHCYFFRYWSSIDPFYLKSLKYIFIREECKIRPIKKVYDSKETQNFKYICRLNQKF